VTVLSLVQAHAICAALFLADLGIRALRIRWYLAGLGHPIRFLEAIQLNAWGDAAAGLTPMRFGGEAARLAGILRAGVPATAGFMAVGLEVMVAYPLVILSGAWLMARFAPQWWRHAGPELSARLALGWPWVIGVLLATLLVGVARSGSRGGRCSGCASTGAPWPAGRSSRGSPPRSGISGLVP